MSTPRSAEEGLLDVAQKKRVLLQVLNFAVLQGRTFEFFGLPRQLGIAGRGAQLHQHIVVVNFSQHDIVDALAHGPDVLVRGHFAQTQIPLRVKFFEFCGTQIGWVQIAHGILS